jgi:hypothetical protein
MCVFSPKSNLPEKHKILDCLHWAKVVSKKERPERSLPFHWRVNTMLPPIFFLIGLQSGSSKYPGQPSGTADDHWIFSGGRR